MLTQYTALVRLITNGLPVDAPNSNMGTLDLTNRTAYLKEILDALTASQMLIVPSAILQAGMSIGTPVYLDGTTNTYRPAISASQSQVAGNPATPQSYFAGIVIDKTSDTLGTIGTQGRFTGLALAGWNALVEGGTAVPGYYYLSSTQAGVLTGAPNGLGVYVGQLSSSGVMDVKPGIPDWASHVHHEFDLWPLPAVANVATDITESGGGAWTITTSNAAYRGWLPANTQPEANVPAGVVRENSFWYNINHPSDSDLLAVFPPIPLDSFVAVKGGAVQPTGRIVVNNFGIWWTQNTNNATQAAPWSENVKTSPGSEQNIQFWFSDILLPTDGAFVQSLGTAAGSAYAIKFADVAGNPATTGNLLATIAAPVQTSSTDSGALALKSTTGGAYTRGPVVTGIKCGGALTASGTAGTAASGYYGTVVLSLLNSALTQGTASIADLNNAKVESISGIQGVTLVAGRTASPTWLLEIPAGAQESNVDLTFWVYVTSDSALPTTNAIQLNYKVVPPAVVPTAIPSYSNLLSFTDSAVGLGPSPRQGLYQNTSALIEIPLVPPGSTVVVQLARSSTDGYGGNITILRVDYTLTAVVPPS